MVVFAIAIHRMKMASEDGTYSLTCAPNHLCAHRDDKAAGVTTHPQGTWIISSL